MDYQKRYRSHILDYQYIKHRKILKSIQFKDMIPIYDLNYKDFTQEFPLCCIGRIRVEKEKEMMGPVRCNGILISENLVLTLISGIVKQFRYTGL